MVEVLTLVNVILGLLSRFVAWGQAQKLWDEHQSIIALTILKKTQEDIQVARQVENELRAKFDANPDSVSDSDGFRRD